MEVIVHTKSLFLYSLAIDDVQLKLQFLSHNNCPRCLLIPQCSRVSVKAPPGEVNKARARNCGNLILPLILHVFKRI